MKNFTRNVLPSLVALSVIGATANAKRLAWAHVSFNLLTGIVALALLPLFWSFTTHIVDAIGANGNLVFMLAIFHTLFNLLGILIMWPIEPQTF